MLLYSTDRGRRLFQLVLLKTSRAIPRSLSERHVPDYHESNVNQFDPCGSAQQLVQDTSTKTLTTTMGANIWILVAYDSLLLLSLTMTW